jgi:hypothetical protein
VRSGAAAASVTTGTLRGVPAFVQVSALCAGGR